MQFLGIAAKVSRSLKYKIPFGVKQNRRSCFLVVDEKSLSCFTQSMSHQSTNKGSSLGSVYLDLVSEAFRMCTNEISVYLALYSCMIQYIQLIHSLRYICILGPPNQGGAFHFDLSILDTTTWQVELYTVHETSSILPIQIGIFIYHIYFYNSVRQDWSSQHLLQLFL